MVKVKERSELVTVNAGENLAKLAAKRFLKPSKYTVLLPYFDELEIEADKHFDGILNGLVTSFLTENTNDASDYYEMFQRYIDEFGCRFTKEKHLGMVRFFYEAITKEHQEPTLLKMACGCVQQLTLLIKQRTFGWRDLTLDWRPMYDLFMRASRGKIDPDPFTSVQQCISSFAVFYDPKEHKAIWERLLEQLSIDNPNSVEKFVGRCWNFLSFHGLSEQEVREYAIDTWFRELWQLYLKVEQNATWPLIIAEYISALCEYFPGVFDFSPYYDVIYTRMIRSFNLTCREGKVSVGDGFDSDSTPSLATISALTIGGPRSSLGHFQRLMRCIHFNIHPDNDGAHVDQIGAFLRAFLYSFQHRLKEERLKEEKRAVPREFYLTDEDVDAVTEAVADVVLMLISSESYNIDSKVILRLITLNREIVAPKLFDCFYLSLDAISQPLRLTRMIDVLPAIIFEAVRLPDREYRAPRHIVFDSKHLKALEMERRNWSTWRDGTDVPAIHKHQMTSLRPHVFYMMELFVRMIDVNDVDRTMSVLKTLNVLISSFPLMDFSDAVQHHPNMSPDDRLVCLLSKRVPHLLEFLLERILDIITCFSVCLPKSPGVNVGASMSSESQFGEEGYLKYEIQDCFKTIFDKADEKLKEHLFARLFAYLQTAEFASFTATDLLSGLVTSAVSTSPNAYKRFATFILDQLKSLLTEDVQKSSETPTSTVLFYSIMAKCIYAATHQMAVENEHVICEITDLLLRCRYRQISKTPSRGLERLLLALTNINTEHAESQEKQNLRKPLNEWNPIDEWARCNHYENTVVKWYVPTAIELGVVQRLSDRYIYPWLLKLNPEKKYETQEERNELRRATSHLMSLFTGVNELLRHPTPLRFISDDFSPATCLPVISSSLGTACIIDWELRGPNGENLREMLVSRVEQMVPCTSDPMILNNFSRAINECLGKSPVLSKFDIEACLAVSLRSLTDNTYIKITKASQYTWDELAALKHTFVSSYHTSETRMPNDFDERIVKLTVEFGLNEYKHVSLTSLMALRRNLSQISRCRSMVVPQVVRELTDQNLEHKDRLIGAIEMLIELNLMNAEVPKLQMIIWDAVVRIKLIDDPIVVELIDTIPEKIEDACGLIGPVYPPGTKGTLKERNAKMRAAGEPLFVHNELWAPHLTDAAIAEYTATWQAYQDSRHAHRVELVQWFTKEHLSNRDLHHSREKVTLSMVYFVQREAADDKTIHRLLHQLRDEEYMQRNEARTWLMRWMQKNKPKTCRVDIVSPSESNTKLQNGLRENNLWLAYDSENLPDTEEKWNRMTFVDKEHVTCRWPRSISVVRKRCDGLPLESRPLTPSDVLILEFFSHPNAVETFFEQRRLEKDDNTFPGAQFAALLKYIIRNYPEATQPLFLFTEQLKKRLASKEYLDQLLAAEIFVGLTQGLKHRSFPEHDTFWRDILVDLNAFFNVMTNEAEIAWKPAMRIALNPDSDLRRVFWLVESLLESVERSVAMTEFQRAFRFSRLAFSRWRHGELARRVSRIAWNSLEFAVTGPVRTQIARVLAASASLFHLMPPSSASLENVPARFIPDTPDVMIRRLVAKVPQLEGACSPRSSQSEPTLSADGPPKKRRRRSSSVSSGSSSDEERAGMTYFRTLLDFIMEFYLSSISCWTPALVELLPKLMEHANEDNYELSEETHRDVDISSMCTSIVHEYMSGAWLGEPVLDRIIGCWSAAYNQNANARLVRIATIKFIQASVYSNIYSMWAEPRRAAVEELLFRSVFDSDIIVRSESAKCLSLFIHCRYIKLADSHIAHLGSILNAEPAEPLIRAHGAALLLQALVLAFPFSLPTEEILKALRILTASRCTRSSVKDVVTEALRDFRTQHRDDWQKTCETLGESLAFNVENATAPGYYA